MLREVAGYLTTPCPAVARRLGYLYQSVALSARAGRQNAAWRPHIEKCHSLVVRAASACPDGGAALILGSGLLLETPVETLLSRFSRLDCLDLVHPRAVRGAYPADRVRLIEADVTGLASAVDESRRKKTAIDLTPPVPPIDDGGYDLIVSSNLLSQLPIALVCALDKTGLYGEDALDRFARDLIRAHLRWLASRAAAVCLIADTAWEYRDRDGVSGIDPLYGVELARPDDSWIWDIAPSGELGRAVSQRNRVAGFVSLGAHNWRDPEDREATR